MLARLDAERMPRGSSISCPKHGRKRWGENGIHSERNKYNVYIYVYKYVEIISDSAEGVLT